MKKLIALLVILSMCLVGSAWAGTIAPTHTKSWFGIWGYDVVKWTSLVAANASGDAQDCRGFTTLTLQIKGTWNTGTLTLQGSVDGTNYLTLTDRITGAAISYAADPTIIINVSECPAYVKPVLAGAGTDDITVTVIGRK